MSKMTVIQLLNKIANRAEVPKKIEYEGGIYEFNKNIHGYWGGKNKDCFKAMVNWRYLNNEVEILEEEKKIPGKLPIYGCTDAYSKFDINDNRKAINEIIDYLKSKGE